MYLLLELLNLYKKLEAGEATDIKGKQKENLENNKELAELSRFLGEINLEVPIEDTLENSSVSVFPPLVLGILIVTLSVASWNVSLSPDKIVTSKPCLSP